MNVIDKLREIVANPNGNQRRAALRKLFGETLGERLKDYNWQHVADTSPLIGNGKDQFNLRPSWSEYRDRCSVPVMAYMVHQTWMNINDNDYLARLAYQFITSISQPEQVGVVRDPLGQGVNKYEFGRHCDWEVDHVWEVLDGHVAGQSKTTRKKTPAPSKPATPPTKGSITVDNHQPWSISTEQKDRDLLDSVLKQVTNDEVSVERIESAINGGLQAQQRAAELEQKLKSRPAAAAPVVVAPVVMPDGLPDLQEVEFMTANEVFRPGEPPVKTLNFEVPVFRWKGIHPDVPEVDTRYVFRTDLLVPVLLSLVDNKKAWVSGHTGTGKSTLVKQVAAHLRWPVITLSLDGEITRMDLIGRDSLTTNKDGQTVSEFVDGVLPRAFSQPCILLCDEIDFVRDDIAYALQTALNENEVTITEDGGRKVRATQWSRIIATANTLGQGDDSGLYRGAKVQSQAFLDRFTTWIEVPYMDENDERALLANTFTALDEEVTNQIMQYTHEHRQGFVNSRVLQPLSPRGVLALADKYLRYQPLFEQDRVALRQAVYETLLNRSNAEDKVVLEGIVNRVFSF